MSRTALLVLVSDPAGADAAYAACGRFGAVAAPPDISSALTLLETRDVPAAVIDLGHAASDDLRAGVRETTGVVLVGPDEASLAAAAEIWPSEVFVDICLLDGSEDDPGRLARSVRRAVDRGRLVRELNARSEALSRQEQKTREIVAEIRDIQDLINENYLKEIEKRIALETRYLWFRKERLKVEGILRKIYGADDVSALLDIAGDIRDIVRAGGVSIYVVEEAESGDRSIKPLVWDNAVLSHHEAARFTAAVSDQDFAADAARSGHPVGATEISFDKRLSPRYAEPAREPLRNLLAVPIVNGPDVIGVIEVTNKIGPDGPGREGFDREDQQILKGLSEHIGMAMTKLNLIQFDALTSLLRPDPFFDKILQKANSRSKRRREEGGFALVMGDVDWFKGYNDRNGHQAGNRLLRELAGVFRLSIREEDLICRYGGEEFLFFLSGVKSLEEACHLTERIRRNVEEHYFEGQEFQPRHNLTMSFGATLFRRSVEDEAPLLDREEIKTLVEECDLALAEAKGKRRAAGPAADAGGAAPDKNQVCAYARVPDGGRPGGGVRAYRPRNFLEKRRAERIYASTQLLFRHRGGFRVTKTVNLSLGGARIVSETPLPGARSLDLILILGDKAAPFESDVVYWERADESSPRYYAGLKFKDISLEDRAALEDFFAFLRKRGSLSS